MSPLAYLRYRWHVRQNMRDLARTLDRVQWPPGCRSIFSGDVRLTETRYGGFRRFSAKKLAEDAMGEDFARGCP